LGEFVKRDVAGWQAEKIKEAMSVEQGKDIAETKLGRLQGIVNLIQNNVIISILSFILFVLFPTVWFFSTEVFPAVQNLSGKKMDQEWNIAVAGFTSVGESRVDGEYAEEIGTVFFNKLSVEMTSLGDEVGLTVLVWGPDQLDPILGATSSDREANAKELTSKLNADIVVYGTVEEIGNSLRLLPEFYVNNFDFETSEISGQYAFGDDIPISGSGGNLISEITTNRELSRRAQALALVTRGLTYYTIHQYEDALDWFIEANSQDEFWRRSENGREIIYQFEGNAYGALYNFEKALEAYSNALTIDPEFARAYAGLGGIYFLQSLEAITDDEFSPDPELLSLALDHFDLALQATNQPISAEIPTKVAFGKGQVFIAQWLAGDDTVREAIDQFEFVIDSYSSSKAPQIQDFAAESKARLGQIYRHQGKLQASLSMYQQAIELSTYPSRRGLFYSRVADLAAALEDLSQAEEANELAIEEYSNAILLTYDEEIIAEYWAAISRRYEALGDIDNAMVALDEAIRIVSGNPELRQYYQGLRVLLGNE
jgi:tetratricopeptide (TPR) repeat protein